MFVWIGFYEIPPAVAKNVAQCCWDLGARHFDTAQAYGNEAELGQWVKESGIDRRQLFITTKLRNSNQPVEKALPSIRHSLELLQTEYVDCLLLHWPVPETRADAWRVLERVLDEGLARSIGVSNYQERHLTELLEHCAVKPAINQIELSPFTYTREVVRACNENHIAVEAYSPLTRGLLLGDPTLVAVAQHYQRTPAQICLRWCLQKGFIALPRSKSPDHIRENLDVFTFQISPQDMATLDGLHRSL
ncbi:putative Prostaglandin F synthase [Paratrimastix pyriformis]|uniref:Prostaglandin F synthase n=1 Tax=Paratrimastix pyriformis TaxID=342808 RepID=A0ABQ8UC14_9EUKA|nr:putative Prostaglandin F synthase [Paratrimastix pyriformis]